MTIDRDDLVRAAMTTDDRLHDIARARIWNGLEDRLAAPLHERARWPYAIAAAIAATVAAVLLAHHGAPEPTIVVVAGDATLTQPIGPHTRAALVGPAELEVVGTSADTTVVRLRRGTFLAEFSGGPNRALRVEAPHAIVDVVGTVFAVEARATATCVSVRHGKVRVTTTAATSFVAAGERYCSDTGTRPITPEIDEALQRHTQILTATAEPTAPSADDLSGSRPDKGSAGTTNGDRPHVSDIATPETPSLSGSRTEKGADPIHAPYGREPDKKGANPIHSPYGREPDRKGSDPIHSPYGREPDKKGSDPMSTSARVSDIAAPQTPSLSGSRTEKGLDPMSTSARTANGDRLYVPDIATARAPSRTEKRADPMSTSARTADASGTSRAPDVPRPGQTALGADELYHAAETALAARDGAAADRALERLIVNHPASPLVEQALYERARIAHGSRAWATARKHLDRLLALPSTRLAEPARYLACRIAVEARDGEAATCLVEYRRAYPRSPHDREVLGLLVQLAHGSGGCTAAAGWLAQLAREHPSAPLTAAWRRRCPEAR